MAHIDLRQIIAKELTRRQWSQRELARQTGMQPHQVNTYLNGLRDLRGETLETILSVLKLEVRPRRRRRK